MISDGYDENSRSGWIRLYRSSLLNGWLKNHRLWVFWCYCLLKASHKVRKVIFGNQQITLKPGQFIFGRKNAAHDTGLSEQSIRTCVESLKTLQNITIKSTNKYSIITIDNWELYQDSENKTTNKTADDQPSGNQQVTTNKNYKNDKHLNSSSDALRLSGLLAERILSNNPSNRSLKNGKKEEVILKWSIAIDKLNRIDMQSFEDIETVIIWSQADDFWKSNILSGDALRKQWDKLTVKMRAPKGNGKHSTPGQQEDPMDLYMQKLAAREINQA